MDVPVVLEIRPEHNLPHVPVGILRSRQLYVELQRARLQKIRKVAESVGTVASAAATDLLVPIMFEVHTHLERMRTASNGETILEAPELLLIVGFVYAITNRGERADNDSAQQIPSRTKCEIAEIPADQGNVLHRIRKAVAGLHFIQKGWRKNAG